MVLNAIGLFRKQIYSHICIRYDLISYKLFIMQLFHASCTHKDIKTAMLVYLQDKSPWFQQQTHFTKFCIKETAYIHGQYICHLILTRFYQFFKFKTIFFKPCNNNIYICLFITNLSLQYLLFKFKFPYSSRLKHNRKTTCYTVDL